jgi:hypothetical protein
MESQFDQEFIGGFPPQQRIEPSEGDVPTPLKKRRYIMWFPSWLRNRKRRGVTRKRPTFRPTLEALEDRWVPSTLTVSGTADSGAGSLRAEIAAAHSGDTIKFAIPTTDPGYNPTTGVFTITLTSGELLIKQNLTIAGPTDRSVTVSGRGHSRVFEVAKQDTVTLSGLTISNGFVVSALAKSGYDTTNGDGAGILNHGMLTVSNCALSHNTASYGSAGSADGGGINNDGTLTVSNSILSYNAAGGGGGIYNERGGNLTVNNNCIVSYNSGGGIYSDGTATISGCQVLNNTGILGGGIANTAMMTVSGCVISGNTAATSRAGELGEGGAIWASSTYYTTNSLTISGCTLSNNSSTGEGGGIYVGNGTVNVINGTTLSGNSAATYGGGIYVYYATVTVSDSTLSSSLASTAGGGGGIYIKPWNNGLQSTVTISGSGFSANKSGPTNTPDNIFGVWIDGGGNTFS